MSRREVVISGRDAGLGSLMEKLRRSSSELGRGLLEEALQNSKSSKDAVSNYEEQIRLIERRNRVYNDGLRQQAQGNLQTKLDSGGGQQARDEHKKTISDITRSSKEDQIQVQLLRELIETVKVTSMQEIRSETSSDESRANLINRTSSQEGSEFGELQRRMFAEANDKPSTPTTPEGGSTNHLGIVSSAGDVMGQRSFLGAASTGLSGFKGAAGVLGKAGMVGVIIAAVKGLVDIPRTLRSGRETSLSSLSAITGEGVERLEATGVGRTNKGQYGSLDLNVSRDEFVGTWLPNIAKARGSSEGIKGLAFSGMELMRGAGVDQSSIFAAEKLAKIGGGNATMMANQLYTTMSKTGKFGEDGKDFSKMGGLLSTLIQLQESQLMSSGTVGNANVNLLTRLNGLGGAFKNGQYTSSTIQSINSGVSQGGTAEAQAMKMDVLRRLNPNKSYFELQAEMEKGVNSKGYLSGIMDMVRGTGGNQDSQMLMFDQLTGGNLRKNDILKMFQGDMNLQDLSSTETTQGFDEMVRGRSQGASSKSQMLLDFEAESLADFASSFGSNINSMIKAMEKFTKFMNMIPSIPGIPFVPKPY